MIHFLLAHWKAEVAAVSVVTGIGLLANEVTSPKVLAVMVFLSDWNMLWTWEWWTRMIIYLVISALILGLQKRKYGKQLALQEIRLEKLQGRLDHTELLLANANTRINVLTKRANGP